MVPGTGFPEPVKADNLPMENGVVSILARLDTTLFSYDAKFCEKFTIKKNPGAKSYKNEKIQSKELNPVT